MNYVETAKKLIRIEKFFVDQMPSNFLMNWFNSNKNYYLASTKKCSFRVAIKVTTYGIVSLFR